MSYVGKVTAGGSTHLVGSTLYGTCGTATGTAAKVVTCSDFDKLETGVTIHVKFTSANTASNATLNVNSTGAKPLCRYGTTRVGTTTATSWSAGAVVSLTYDGTSWVMNDFIPDTNTPNTDVLMMQHEQSASNTNHPLLASLMDTGSWTSGLNSASEAYLTPNVYLNPHTGNIVATSFNGYALSAASAKGVDTSFSDTTSTALPTTAAVAAYVATQMGDVAGALVYKGTVSAGSELLNTALKKGWYYIVDTAGSYAGVTCEPGDMIIVNTAGTYTTASALAAVVDIIQTNIDTISNSDIDTIVAS